MENLAITEPNDTRIDDFFGVQKRRLKGFEAPKLLNLRSASFRDIHLHQIVLK